MNVPNNIKKRFTSDFRLPINIYSEPYFEYFMELYNEEYGIDKKVLLLNEVTNDLGTPDEFFKYAEKLAENIKTQISSSKAYAALNEADMNDYPLIEKVSQQNIYIPENVGKRLISIDLNKANFNSLDIFGIKNEINAHSYEELIKQHSSYQYFVESKQIRQVIFGNLNPKRQQRIQKYIINNFCEALIKNGYELTSASSDEIIIKNSDAKVSEIKEILKDFPQTFQFYRVEEFSFKQIDNQNEFYVKNTIQEDGNNKTEFKNIPGHLFAQVFKKYKGLEINEYDLMFIHEKLLSRFMESIYSPEYINQTNAKKKRM